MLKVGLTGNIGSGKTIVSKVFRIFGIPVFYADNVAKDITENNEKVIKEYKKWFGEDIFINGKLNRLKLANIIFNDNEALEKVNSLIHPLVIESFLNWIKNFEKSPYVIFESAVLYNTVFTNIIDMVILVTSPIELKINRVIKRDGRSIEEIRKILSKQVDEEILIKMADYIIDNNEKELIIPRIIDIHNDLLNKTHSVNY